MAPDPDRPQKSREDMLATSLVILVGSMILFYLYMISLGIVGNVLAIGVAFVMLGTVHYVIWGRAFSEEVAAEREAMLRQEAREEKRSKSPPDAIQDIGRTHGIQNKP